MNERRIGGWIQTYTGRQFWPLDPRPEEVFIEDIAHHLSQICRFTGACAQFYSVAQHSVEVSKIAPRRYALWGLLHDAPEAYLGDLTRPVKPSMADYQIAEFRLARCIAERFRLSWPMPAEIRVVDDEMLATEKRDLLGSEPAPWAPLPQPRPEKLKVHGPVEAEAVFLANFNFLRGTK